MQSLISLAGKLLFEFFFFKTDFYKKQIPLRKHFLFLIQ